MIAIEIKGGPALERALKLAPVQVARELSHELRAWSINGTSDFQKKRLGVADDRNRGDFLLRRPRTSKGLRRVTGGIARAMYARSQPVDRIADIRAVVGFLSGKAAQIARVHELGTVRYGGKLPDIVPRKGKYLKARISGGTAGRTAAARIVNLKKVGIPPRLGWVAWWTNPTAIKALAARVVKAAQRALKTVASRG